jgi:Na+-translocating ferredoxin:NAD+ oxidoreductase subunit B
VGTLADALDRLLPQTQCTRCGYAGCRPYAEAIERGEAQINQCPPGGSTTIAALAAASGRAAVPLNPEHGVEGPPRVAVIDEERCIGCAKCLPPCPVDAIVGAPRQMHTVVRELCTGCELCLPPCPVDCISVVPVDTLPEPALSRTRYDARNARLDRREAERAELIAARKRAAHPATQGTAASAP